jgi:hypothetical protein
MVRMRTSSTVELMLRIDWLWNFAFRFRWACARCPFVRRNLCWSKIYRGDLAEVFDTADVQLGCSFQLE